jgi:SAM-dependent methyltransferase
MRNTPSRERAPSWEARFRRKQAHRGRGLADLEERVGAVRAAIDARLRDRPRVRVLELGCGYAIALLDLAARYGARIETFGVNLTQEAGQQEILQREAGRRCIDVAAQARLPTLVHTDVAHGLPFADDTFDLVVSQVAWRYFRNKIGVLREVVRVLQAGGAGMIDADEFDPKLPAEYGRLVEIWDDRALVPFGEYLARHAMGFVPTARGRALRVTKSSEFGRDLEARLEIDVKEIHADWDGIKCVYALTRV